MISFNSHNNPLGQVRYDANFMDEDTEAQGTFCWPSIIGGWDTGSFQRSLKETSREMRRRETVLSIRGAILSPKLSWSLGYVWSCLWSVAGAWKSGTSSGGNEVKMLAGLGEAHVLIHR